MRIFSKICSLCVIICLIFSFAVSAHAVQTRDYAADYTDWPTTFSAFDVVSMANAKDVWNAYTCVVQRFLGTYSRDFEDVLDSNGNPSGKFTNVTHEAVKDYQRAKGNMSVDGIVGSGTWSKFASDLRPIRNGVHTYFKDIDEEEYVVKAEESNYRFTFYYYYLSGGQYAIAQFRS